MPKLSKIQAKKHKEALALVRSKRPLTLDERDFVIENYHEGAEHMNGLVGAFFTPEGLARDFAIEVPDGCRVLDLCAGIGMLSYQVEDKAKSIVCVERNHAYVEVGRAVLPKATWVEADVFDVAAYEKFGPFDVVISNPPFGAIPVDGFEGSYTGGKFELKLLELASRLGARYGVFLLPQQSTPFRYSGKPEFKEQEDEHLRKFREQTGVTMEMNCGFDTTSYLKDWKGVAPVCEIVTCEFDPKARPLDLLELAASLPE